MPLPVWGLLTDATTDPLAAPAVHVYGTNFYDGSLYMGPLWVGAIGLLIVAAAVRPRARRAGQWELLGVALLFVIAGWDGVGGALSDQWNFLRVERIPFRLLAPAVFLASVFLIRELDELGRGTGWKRAAHGLALLILVVPLYGRNAYFNHAATTSEPDRLAAALAVSENLETGLAARVAGGGPSLIYRATPNRFEVDPLGSDRIEVMWLTIDPMGWLDNADFSVLWKLNKKVLGGRRRKPPPGSPRLASFEYHNATPTEATLHGTTLQVHDPTQRVVLEARRFGAPVASLLALFVFAVDTRMSRPLLRWGEEGFRGARGTDAALDSDR